MGVTLMEYALIGLTVAFIAAALGRILYIVMGK
jgi:hypothetical protein